MKSIMNVNTSDSSQQEFPGLVDDFLTQVLHDTSADESKSIQIKINALVNHMVVGLEYRYPKERSYRKFARAVHQVGATPKE